MGKTDEYWFYQALWLLLLVCSPMILWKGEHLIKAPDNDLPGSPRQNQVSSKCCILDACQWDKGSNLNAFHRSTKPQHRNWTLIDSLAATQILQLMDATLSMDAMAPALSQKIKTSRSLLGAVTCKACKKGGRNLQIGLNRGIGCHGIHLLYHHGRKSTFPNRLVNQTAKRLVEAQLNPLCLPGSGWTWSWKDIQPQTNDVRCQMRGQWSGVTKVFYKSISS